MRHLLRSLFRNQNGVALIEFAMVFPLIMILIIFTLEFSRFYLIQLKVQKTSYAIGNIITRFPAATATPAQAGEINQDILTNDIGINQIIKMIGTNNIAQANNVNVSAIVSSVRNQVTSKTGLVVKWQACISGAGGCWMPSVVTQAAVGPIAGFKQNTPANFAAPYSAMLTNMRDQENIIVVEISYSYAPRYLTMFQGLGSAYPFFSYIGLQNQTITHVAFFAPRDLGSSGGGLGCLPPSATGGANTVFSYLECPCSNNTYDGGCTTLVK